VVSTGTLGFYEHDGFWAVSDYDRAMGYDTAVMFSRGGAEIGLGVATGGAAKWMATGGKALQYGSYAVRGFDAAGNVTSVGRGGVDMYNNGVTLQNALQVGAGTLATVGDFADLLPARGVRGVGVDATAVQRTNAQLVQDIATRADAWAVRKGITGTAQDLGIKKHGYAESVLNRYQDIYGQRGLQTEVSVINGARVRYNAGGSVRLDVIEGNIANPTAIYDYKFGTSGLTSGRINQIRNRGGYPTVPIIQVRP
jgi:hypothetical protein